MRGTGFEVEISLRAVDEADLPVLYEHQRDPEACRMAVFNPREREAFMAHWQTTVLGSPDGVQQAILVGRELAGHLLSWTLHDRRTVGYWLGRAYWGRGVATYALGQFLRAHELARPLYADVAVSNFGSVRVLEKCGFVAIGPATLGPDHVLESLMRLD